MPRDSGLSIGGFRYFYRLYPALPGSVARLDPIVLLTGAFQTLDAWTKLARSLQRSAPVLVVDLPGLGTADPLPAKYGVDFHVRALLQVLEMERIPRVNVGAPSYSVPAAYRFASVHPDRVNRLVLVGTMKGVPAHYVAPIEESIRLLQVGDLDAFGAILIERFTADPRLTEKGALVQRIMWAAVRSLSPENRRRYHENSTRLLLHSGLDLAAPPVAPTLIFTGCHDNFTIPEFGREVAAALPDAAFATIERADHLCHLHWFPVVERLISVFFSGLPLDGVAGCSPIEHFGSVAPSPVSLVSVGTPDLVASRVLV